MQLALFLCLALVWRVLAVLDKQTIKKQLLGAAF